MATHPITSSHNRKIWFTADLHLGHANILRYCRRPFLSPAEEQLLYLHGPRGAWRVSRESAERHDRELITEINSLVAAEDQLWIVGDFSLAGEGAVRDYRSRIRCRHVGLIIGNHDRPENMGVFDTMADTLTVEAEGHRFWLCHYPQRDWPGRSEGVLHLYGHVHGKRLEPFDGDVPILRCNVGVDVWSYRPVSVRQLLAHFAVVSAGVDPLPG